MAMDPSQITTLPGISDVLAKGADKLMEAVSTYGPQATELALEVGRFSAMKDLAAAIGGTALGVGLLSAVAAPCLRRFLAELKNPTGDAWSYTEGRQVKESVVYPNVIGMVVSAIFGAPPLLIGAGTLLDPFLWVGLWHPEIYLAAKLMDL